MLLIAFCLKSLTKAAAIGTETALAIVSVVCPNRSLDSEAVEEVSVVNPNMGS